MRDYSNKYGGRTRFLNDLYKMISVDKDGAIDDMLQVLLECGAVRVCEMTFEVPAFPDARWENPDYQQSLRDRMGEHMGHFLMKESCIKTEFKPGENHFTKNMRGSLGVVLTKDKRP